MSKLKVLETWYTSLAKGPGRGWWGPPRGTHGVRKDREPLRFSNASDADKWALSQPSLNPELTEDQDEGMQQYKSDDFYTLNDELRMADYSEIRLNSDPDQYVDELIESSIAKTSLPESVIVYRGADLDTFEDDEDLTGSTITDNAFVSTSMASAIAESHSGGVMVEIRLPKDTKAIFMDGRWGVSGYDTESELLLQKGSTFKVISDVSDPKEEGTRYERSMVWELVL